MTWQESKRMHLVDDCPDGLDIDLPTDGKWAAARRVVIVVMTLAWLAAAVMVFG